MEVSTLDSFGTHLKPKLATPVITAFPSSIHTSGPPESPKDEKID